MRDVSAAKVALKESQRRHQVENASLEARVALANDDRVALAGQKSRTTQMRDQLLKSPTQAQGLQERVDALATQGSSMDDLKNEFLALETLKGEQEQKLNESQYALAEGERRGELVLDRISLISGVNAHARAAVEDAMAALPWTTGRFIDACIKTMRPSVIRAIRDPVDYLEQRLEELEETVVGGPCTCPKPVPASSPLAPGPSLASLGPSPAASGSSRAPPGRSSAA